jgi:hypothetical protein
MTVPRSAIIPAGSWPRRMGAECQGPLVVLRLSLAAEIAKVAA